MAGELQRLLVDDLAVALDLAARGPAPFDCLPAALLPLGTRPALEHVIGTLARAGETRLLVRTTSHAAVVRDLLKDGRPWDLALRLVGADWKPDLASRGRLAWMPGHLVEDADPDRPSSTNPRVFSTATLEDLVLANLELLRGNTVGLDEPAAERSPRVRVAHACTGISARAILVPPVSIGPDVVVSSGARIGPNVLLTDRVVVGRGARIRDSILSSGMSVGAGSAVRGVVAIGVLVVEAAFPGCKAYAAQGLLALPPARRFFGIPLRGATEAPRP